MSFQSFVTERLAAITGMLNAISTNAKKIDELPTQSNLDTASKLHVSRGGISEKIEIKQIVDFIKDGSSNQLISIGDIGLAGTLITIPANATWKINNILYSNIASIQINSSYADIGLSRKDILVANDLNSIYLVKGDETAGITIRPNIPTNTVLVTEMDVTDNSILIIPPDPIDTGPIPYLNLRFVAKGVGNMVLDQEQPGDFFAGCKDATTYWALARWNGGDRMNRTNYSPIIEVDF